MQNNINTELEEQQLAAARESYLRLQAEVKLWQENQSPDVVTNHQLATSSPYLPLEGLPEESILDLWARLNQVAGESLEGADLRDLLHSYKNGEILDDSAVARLQLALAGVAQLYCRSLMPVSGEEYQSFGACPVCGEKHFMTLLTPPVGKRYQKCLICSYQRPINASGCACCGNIEPKKQTYLKSDSYPGIEVGVCSDCGWYFKQVDLRVLKVEDLVWEDIRTMPLNFAAEKWLAGQKGWN